MLPLILVASDRKQAGKYIHDLLKRLYEGHEVYEFRPDPNNITIDQIRGIATLFKYASKISKVIIIYDFESSKEETQNAFLKTLEEESEKAQFIIVTRDVNALLPTVLSRGQIVKLIPDTKTTDTYDFSLLTAEMMAKKTLIKRDKNEAVLECDHLLHFFRQEIFDQEHENPNELAVYSQIIKEIIQVRQYIEKNNINPQLALDHLIIFIKTRLPLAR